jgi:hypothetical protein
MDETDSQIQEAANSASLGIPWDAKNARER